MNPEINQALNVLEECAEVSALSKSNEEHNTILTVMCKSHLIGLYDNKDVFITKITRFRVLEAIRYIRKVTGIASMFEHVEKQIMTRRIVSCT